MSSLISHKMVNVFCLLTLSRRVKYESQSFVKLVFCGSLIWVNLTILMILAVHSNYALTNDFRPSIPNHFLDVVQTDVYSDGFM